MAICQKCGKQMPDGTQFCPSCGSMQRTATPQTSITPGQSYYTPSQPKSPKGKSIAAMVLGIVSICTCCFYGIVGLVTGIVGLALAVIAKRDAEKLHTSEGNGMRTAGMVCSIIGIVLSAIYFVYCCIAGFTLASWSSYDDIYDYLAMLQLLHM